MYVTRQHPNATAVAGTTGFAVLIVFVLGLFGIPITAEVAAAASGLLGVIVLAVGRHGLAGLASIAWRGSGDDGGA